jgi:hypothetical protein
VRIIPLADWLTTAAPTHNPPTHPAVLQACPHLCCVIGLGDNVAEVEDAATHRIQFVVVSSRSVFMFEVSLVLLMIASPLSPPGPSVAGVRPHWRKTSRRTVKPVTGDTQIRHFVMAIT